MGELTALNKGLFVEDDQITFSEYLDFWLDNHAKNNTSPKTYKGYRYIISQHIKPTLGGIKISKLNPAHLQNYYSSKLSNGRMDGQGGLFSQSVKHHHRLISKALSDAVKWQRIVRNVAESVDSPKTKKLEMKTLGREDVGSLLEMAKSSLSYYPIIFTAIPLNFLDGKYKKL